MIPVVPARIAAFGSRGVTVHHPTGATLDELFMMDGSSSVVIGELAAGALIGRHPAIDAQLLFVVSGSVVVTAGTESTELRSGQAVLFDAGEEHETHAVSPSTVLIWERRGAPPRTRR